MKNLRYTLSLLAGLFLFFACTNTDSQQAPELSGIEIPELLERPDALRYGAEWENVQNKYATWKLEAESGNTDPEALLNLAQLFTLEARVGGEHGHYYPAALQVLDQLLQQKDISPDLRFRALTTKGSVLLSQHEFAQAYKTGKEGLALNNHNARIFGVMVDACVELGRYEEAVQYADQMVSIRPDLRSYSRISYLREIHGLPEAAIEAMEMAVAAGAPGSEELAWTRLQLGELLSRYGQAQEARAHFEYILQERPDYPFAIAAIADLEAKAGNNEQAEMLLKKACAIIPEVGFYEQLAALYYETDRREEADQLAEEVMAMLKDDTEHGHNMDLEYANFYLHTLDQPEQALTYAQREYEKRPENITINLLLADIYHALGNTEQANRHLELASVTNSVDPDLVGLQEQLASNN